jgi:hypothetical protein
MSDAIENGWIMKIAMGVASATVVGGGTMVLGLHRNDAVQDERIGRNEITIQKIEKLDEKLDDTLRKVDLLNARLDLKEVRDESRNQ